ncbi:MAG TPA: alanine--glyoxylate aminotransferase family protein, partial [Planctomycetota bacterium]|nr:alanine--glyoxylate aminotransferase family protein [Planctomycetota bacterium]
GFRPFAAEGRRLPMLHSVWLPDGSDDRRLRSRLLTDHGIEVGGGLGEIAGKVWRIGLMGESCRRENVLRLVAGLEDLLASEKIGGRVGRGIEAAVATYATS